MKGGTKVKRGHAGGTSRRAREELTRSGGIGMGIELGEEKKVEDAEQGKKPPGVGGKVMGGVEGKRRGQDEEEEVE